MSTDILRKYIDIINEAKDPNLRKYVLDEIQRIHDGAAKGINMTDDIVDELGDYFNEVKRSGDPVLQKAYAHVRGFVDATAQEQRHGAAQAIAALKNAMMMDKYLGSQKKSK